MQFTGPIFDSIDLSIGDLIADLSNNHRGFLIRRHRHIDMFQDDIWLWEVHWFTFSSKKESLDNPINSVTIMEEENLKFFILVGRIEWYSIKGVTWNAEDAQLERI